VSLPDLHLDFIGRDLLAFACHRWHYSRSVPASKVVAFGAIEAGRYVGCVAFSRGASSEIHSPFGLQQSEACPDWRIDLVLRVRTGTCEGAEPRNEYPGES
jgi:hypothetical protein